MSEFMQGLVVGSTLACGLCGAWMTWLASREHYHTIKILDNHLEWLRQYSEKLGSQDEDWKA